MVLLVQRVLRLDLAALSVQQLHGFPVHCRAQAHVDLVRTEARDVVRVVPDLQHGQAEPLRVVGVGDRRRTVARVNLHRADRVAFRNLLHPGVVQRHAVVVGGQACHLQRPGVLVLQRELRLVRVGVLVHVIRADRKLRIRHVVRQQLHRHRLGTLRLLVLAVVPDLRHLGLGLVCLVGVGDGLAVTHLVIVRCVALDLVLLHGVDDFHAFLALRQVVEGHGVGVVAVVRHSLGHGRFDDHFDAVGHQVHALRVLRSARTVVVVVVIVVPDLGDLHRGGLGLIRVGDLDLVSVLARLLQLAVDRLVVLVHRGLLDRVDDLHTLLALGVLRQAVPGVAPLAVLALRQRDGFAFCSAIRQQLHFDAARALAVLVLRVVPRLLHRQLNRLRLVRVLERDRPGVLARLRQRRLVGQLVALDLVLLQGVHDLVRLVRALRLRVLRQASLDPDPFAVSVRLDADRLHELAVGHQLHVHVVRTHAVAVLLVLPLLLDRDLDRLGLVGVGQVGDGALRHRLLRRVDAESGLVLNPGVGEVVLRHTGHHRGPVVLLVQRVLGLDRLARGIQQLVLTERHRLAVDHLHQGHLDAVRTEARDIVRVVPDLQHFQAVPVGVIGVGDGGVAVLIGGDQRHRIVAAFADRLDPAVGLLLAGHVLRQLADRQRPGVVFPGPGDILGVTLVGQIEGVTLHGLVVRQQLHRDRGVLALAGRVVVVVPDLGDRGLGGLQLVVVGHLEGGRLVGMLSRQRDALRRHFGRAAVALHVGHAVRLLLFHRVGIQRQVEPGLRLAVLDLDPVRGLAGRLASQGEVEALAVLDRHIEGLAGDSLVLQLVAILVVHGDGLGDRQLREDAVGDGEDDILGDVLDGHGHILVAEERLDRIGIGQLGLAQLDLDLLHRVGDDLAVVIDGRQVREALHLVPGVMLEGQRVAAVLGTRHSLVALVQAEDDVIAFRGRHVDPFLHHGDVDGRQLVDEVLGQAAPGRGVDLHRLDGVSLVLRRHIHAGDSGFQLHNAVLDLRLHGFALVVERQVVHRQRQPGCLPLAILVSLGEGLRVRALLVLRADHGPVLTVQAALQHEGDRRVRDGSVDVCIQVIIRIRAVDPVLVRGDVHELRNVLVGKRNRVLQLRAVHGHGRLQPGLRLVAPVNVDHNRLRVVLVVGEAFDLRRGVLGDGVGVGVGLAEDERAEHAMLAGRQLQLRDLRQRAVLFLRRKGEGEGARIVAGFVGQGLEHRNLRRRLAVVQLGQDDQRRFVAFALVDGHFLDRLLGAFHPAIDRLLDPLVGVALALGAHLLHADGHRGPVVVLVEGRRVDRLLLPGVDLAAPQGLRQAAVEFHIHGQAAVHIGLAVHQPLLGHSHAELAGGVDVHQAGLRLVAAGRDVIRVLQAAQLLQPGHGAHVGIGLHALAHRIARRRDLGHGVGAHRQVLDSHRRAGVDLEDLRVAVVLAQAVLGHVVDRLADGHGHLRVEDLAAEVSGLVLAVHEHALVDGQLARVQRVGDLEGEAVLGVAALRDLRSVAVDRGLGHVVGDLLALLVHRQLLPRHGQGRALGVRGDGLRGFVNVHIVGHAVDHIGAGQRQHHILAQRFLVLVVGPDLGGLHRGGQRLVMVDDLAAVLSGVLVRRVAEADDHVLVLDDHVVDLVEVVVIHRQAGVGHGVGVVAVVGDNGRHVGHQTVIRVQADQRRIVLGGPADAVLVVRVVPGLRDEDLGGRTVHVLQLDGRGDFLGLALALGLRQRGLALRGALGSHEGVVDQQAVRVQLGHLVGAHRQVLDGVFAIGELAVEDLADDAVIPVSHPEDQVVQHGQIFLRHADDGLHDLQAAQDFLIGIGQVDVDGLVFLDGAGALGGARVDHQGVVRDQAFRVGLLHGVFAHRQFVDGVHAVGEVLVGDALDHLAVRVADFERQVIHIGVGRDAREILHDGQAAQVRLVGVDELDLSDRVLLHLGAVRHRALFRHEAVAGNQALRAGLGHEVQAHRQLLNQVAELAVHLGEFAVGEGRDLLAVRALHGEAQGRQVGVLGDLAFEGLDDLQAAQVFLVDVGQLDHEFLIGLGQRGAAVDGALVHQEGVARDQAVRVHFLNVVLAHRQVLDGVAVTLELAVEHLLHNAAVRIGHTEHQAAQDLVIHIIGAFEVLDDDQLAQVFLIGIGQVDVDGLVLLDRAAALGGALVNHQGVVLDQTFRSGLGHAVLAHRQVVDGVHAVREVRVGDGPAEDRYFGRLAVLSAGCNQLGGLALDDKLQGTHIGVGRDAREVLHDGQAAQVRLVGVGQFDGDRRFRIDRRAAVHRAVRTHQAVVRVSQQAVRVGLGHEVGAKLDVGQHPSLHGAALGLHILAVHDLIGLELAVGEGLGGAVRLGQGEAQVIQQSQLVLGQVVRAREGLQDDQITLELLIGVVQGDGHGFVLQDGDHAVRRIGLGADQAVVQRGQQLVLSGLEHGVFAHRQVLDHIGAVDELRVEDVLAVIVRAFDRELQTGQLDVSRHRILAEVEVLDDLQIAQLIGVVVDHGGFGRVAVLHHGGDLAVVRHGQAQALDLRVLRVLQHRVAAHGQVAPGRAAVSGQLEPGLALGGSAVGVVVDVGAFLAADHSDLVGLVLKGLSRPGLGRHDLLGHGQVADILGVLVVDGDVDFVVGFLLGIQPDDLRVALAGHFQREALHLGVVMILDDGVGAHRQVLPGDLVIRRELNPLGVLGRSSAVDGVVNTLGVLHGDLPGAGIQLAADDRHGLLDNQLALVLVVLVVNGGLRRFLALVQHLDLDAFLIAVGDGQAVVLHLGAILVFLDEVGAHRQVHPGDRLVRGELNPLVLLGDHIAVDGVVGLFAVLILAVHRDAEGLAAVDVGAALGHGDSLLDGQRADILRVRVLEEHLREVLAVQRRCRRQAVLVRFLLGGGAVAANLHARRAPGVARNHAAVGLGDAVAAHGQVLQHQHALAEVRVGEGALFLRQRRPLAVDVAVLGGGCLVVDHIVGLAVDLGGDREGQLGLHLVVQRHRRAVHQHGLVELEHAGHKRVGDRRAVDGLGVEILRLRVDNLVHGVGDLDAVFAFLILRQILELVAPVAVRIGFDRGHADQIAVRVQAHGDVRRTQADAGALVGFVARPDLLALQGDGIRLVRVGDAAVPALGAVAVQRNRAVLGIRFVLGHQVFLGGVHDVADRAVHVLQGGQAGVADGVGAVAVVGHGLHRVGDLRAVGVEVHHRRVFLRGGTIAVLVVRVGPGLGDLHPGGLRGVGVDQLAAVRRNAVRRFNGVGMGLQRGQILVHGVLDRHQVLVRVRLVLGQAGVGDGVGAVAIVGDRLLIGGQFGLVESFTVRIELHGVGVFVRAQAQAVAVVVVVPHLGDGDFGLLGLMLVGQEEAVLRVAVLALEGVVAGQIDGGELVHIVFDLLAAFAVLIEGVLGQLGELVRPPVVLRQHLLRHGLAVGVEDHGDFSGTHAVLVIDVVPDLLHRDFGLLGLVGVLDEILAAGAGDRHGVDGLLVALDHLDRVAVHQFSIANDLADLVGVVGVQVVPGLGPVVAVIQLNRLAVRGCGGLAALLLRRRGLVQLHLDHGPLAVHVVPVVPDLLDGDAGGVRRVVVGDGHLRGLDLHRLLLGADVGGHRARLHADHRPVLGQRFLLPGVGGSRAVDVGGHSEHSAHPLAVFVRRERYNAVLANRRVSLGIGLQGDLQRFNRRVRTRPDLFDLDILHLAVEVVLNPDGGFLLFTAQRSAAALGVFLALGRGHHIAGRGARVAGDVGDAALHLLGDGVGTERQVHPVAGLAVLDLHPVRLLAEVLAVQAVVVAFRILHGHQEDLPGDVGGVGGDVLTILGDRHLLGHVQLAGLVVVLDLQALRVLILIIGDGGVQFLGIGIFRDSHDHIVDDRFAVFVHVIGHAGRVAGGLLDDVLVGAGLGIGDLVEHTGAAILDGNRIGRVLRHRRTFHGLEGELERLVLVVARGSRVAGDLLGHLRLRGDLLIGVLHRQGGHVVRVDRGRRQDAGLVVLRDSHDELLHRRVVVHARGAALFLDDVVAVRAGHGEFEHAEHTGLAVLDLHFRRVRRRHLAGEDGRAIGQLRLDARDRELELLIRVVVFSIRVALDQLGDLGLRGDLAVGQLGQDHQGAFRGIRALGHVHGLDLLLLALGPAVHLGLHPAVLVTDAIVVKLVHANHDRRPVVGLGQGDGPGVLVKRGVRVLQIHGRGAPGRTVRGALQRHGQRQVVIRLHMTVHQPLLRHRQAELARGIGIDHAGLGGHIALRRGAGGFGGHRRGVRHAAQVRQEGQSADGRALALAKGVAVRVLDLGQGVLAHRDVLEGQAGLRRDAQGHRVRRQGAVRVHIVGHLIDHRGDLDVEGAACVLALRHLLAVDEQVLADLERAVGAGVGDQELQAILREHAAVLVVLPLAGHAVHGGLHHGEVHAGGQALDLGGAGAHDGQRRHAVHELDRGFLGAGDGVALVLRLRALLRGLAVVVDVRVRVDGELILPVAGVLVHQRADHSLLDGQVRHFAGVGEIRRVESLVHVGRGEVVSAGNGSRQLIRLRREAGHRRLRHGVLRAQGQTGDQHTAVAVHRHLGLQGAVRNRKRHIAVGRGLVRDAALQIHREGEVLIRVGGVVADDLLGDQQVAGPCGFIHVGDRHRAVLGERRPGHGQDAVLVSRHGEGDFLLRRVVGHAGRLFRGLGLLHGELVFAFRDDAAEDELLRLAVLQRQAGAGGQGHAVDTHGLRVILIRGQGHGERFGAVVGIAGHGLLHRDLHVRTAVLEDGQHHQGVGVFAGRAFGHGDGLLLDKLALSPTVRHGLFHPAVFVAHAAVVHLLHADGDVGPVVVFVQLNAGLAFHGRPLGVGIRGQLALQIHGQGQLVIHIGLAVHQPLLGHGHAELAGGVGVDQADLGGFAVLNLSLFLNMAQFEQVGHVAHAAGRVRRINLLRARAIRILLHLVGQAHRQVQELRSRARLQRIAERVLQGHFRQLGELIHIARAGVARAHEVLRAVDLRRQHEEEVLGRVIAVLVRTVDEDRLVHVQLAHVAGVLDLDRLAANVNHALGAVVRSQRRAGRAGRHHRGREAIRRLLDHGVVDASRQAFDGRRLAALQLDLCDAIGEFRVAKRAINVGVQIDCEGELLIRIARQLAVQRLGDRQVAFLAGVREGHGCFALVHIRGVGIVLDRTFSDQAGRCRRTVHREGGGEAALRGLSHLVGRADRQIGQLHGVAVVQGDGDLAACDLHAAVDAVGQRGAVRVLQLHREGELLPLVGGVDAHHGLADLQVTGHQGVVDVDRADGAVRIAAVLIDGGLRRGVALTLGVEDLRHPQGDSLRRVDGHLVLRVVPGHQDIDGLVHVVGDRGIVAVLVDHEGIRAGLGDAGQLEEPGLAGLDGQRRLRGGLRADGRRIGVAAVADGDVAVVRSHALRQAEAGHLDLERRVGVAVREDLLHRHARAHGVVDQLGQEGQLDLRGIVVVHVLGLHGDGLAHGVVQRRGVRLVGVGKVDEITGHIVRSACRVRLDPAVAVAMAFRVHLLHAHRHCGPVVVLGQLDDLAAILVVHDARVIAFGHRVAQVILLAQVDVVHVRPVGFHRGLRGGILDRPLQLHEHHRVLGRGRVAVHQPLLGDGDAVLAGGVAVDQRSLRGLALLHLRGSLRVGDQADELPAVDLAVLVGDRLVVRRLLRALVDILGHGVLAQRQLLEQDRGVNRDSQVLLVVLDVGRRLDHGGIALGRAGDHVIDRLGSLAALGRSRGDHRTGHGEVVFLVLQIGIFAAGLLALGGSLHLLVVQEDGLADLQLAALHGVDDLSDPDAVLVLRAGDRGFGGADVAFGHLDLDHLVADLVAVVVLGQVGPVGNPSSRLTGGGGGNLRLRVVRIHRAVEHNVADVDVLDLVLLRGDVALGVLLVDRVHAKQTERDLRAGSRGLILVGGAVTVDVPLLGGLDFGADRLMLVGQAGQEGQRAAVLGGLPLVDRGDLGGVGDLGIACLLSCAEALAVLAHPVGDRHGVGRRQGLVGRLADRDLGIAEHERRLTPHVLDRVAELVVAVHALDDGRPVVGVVQQDVVHIGGGIVVLVVEGVLILRLRRNTRHLHPVVHGHGAVHAGLALAPELHLDGIRAHAVAVMLVVPGLGDGHAVLADIGVKELDHAAGVNLVRLRLRFFQGQIVGFHAVTGDRILGVGAVLHYQLSVRAHLVELLPIVQLHKIRRGEARLRHGVVVVQVLQIIGAVHGAALGHHGDACLDHKHGGVRLDIGQCRSQLANAEVVVALVVGVAKVDLREIDFIIPVVHHGAAGVLPLAGDGVQLLHDKGEDLVLVGDGVLAVLAHPLHELPGFEAGLHAGIVPVMAVEVPLRAAGHHAILGVGQNPACTVLVGNTARVGRQEQAGGVNHVQHIGVIGVEEDVTQDHIVHGLVVDGVSVQRRRGTRHRIVGSTGFRIALRVDGIHIQGHGIAVLVHHEDLELIDGDLRAGDVEHDGLARQLFNGPKITADGHIRRVHIDGLVVGEHGDIQRSTRGHGGGNVVLRLHGVGLRLAVGRQLVHIAVDLVLGLHDEVHIVSGTVLRADRDIVPAVGGRVEVRVGDGAGLDRAGFHRRGVERDQVGAGAADVNAAGGAHFLDGEVGLGVGAAGLIAVGHDAVLRSVTQNVGRLQRLLIVDLVEIDMVNNGGDVVFIIIDAVDVILVAGVIGDSIRLIVDDDRRALGDLGALLGDAEGEVLVAGDGIIGVANMIPVQDGMTVLAGHILHGVGDVGLAAGGFHHRRNRPQVHAGLVAMGGLTGHIVHQEGVLAGRLMLNFDTEVNVILGHHRRRTVQHDLHLVDLLVGCIQTQVGVGLGDGLALRGLLGGLAVFVVPEIIARNHVRAGRAHVLQIRGHLGVVLQLVQTDIAGIDRGIIVQAAARDVAPAVVHQLEGFRAEDGLGELAGLVGRREALRRHGDDLHAHQLAVVIQADPEEVLTAEISALHQGAADGIGMVLIELDVEVMVHAGIRILLEHGRQNLGDSVGVLIRLGAVCHG